GAQGDGYWRVMCAAAFVGNEVCGRLTLRLGSGRSLPQSICIRYQPIRNAHRIYNSTSILKETHHMDRRIL
ncbi:hypothetical protein, partial [Rhizobium leguminosarum]|uniref:hypothetical protein n=1 Tax=Rhizobium leguminosarum TaxID=384 RepID=UPI001981C8A5